MRIEALSYRAEGLVERLTADMTLVYLLDASFNLVVPGCSRIVVLVFF